MLLLLETKRCFHDVEADVGKRSICRNLQMRTTTKGLPS